MSDTADPDLYLTQAERLVLALPEGTEFVSAHLQKKMRDDGWPELAEPRRLGPLLLHLRDHGYINKIGVLSTAARSHGGMTSQWRRTNKETPNA